MQRSRRFAVLLLVAGWTLPAAATTVDHGDIAAVAGLPQATTDAIGQQRWFFSHASVGGNMVAGMDDLHGADPARFQLATAWVGYDSGDQRADDPPAPTVAGTVYECNRSNPGWSAKLTIFDNSVRTSGWRLDAVDVAMDKLCYIDEDADAGSYTAMMSALETTYPSTVFVYITMPLTTGSDSANIQRNSYNDAVRSFCDSHGCLLFDLADMEAHQADGTPCTFTSGAETYQQLCTGYSDDGGHLNATGRQRIATGWYAVAAAIAASDDVLFTDGFEDGTTAGWSDVTP